MNVAPFDICINLLVERVESKRKQVTFLIQLFYALTLMTVYGRFLIFFFFLFLFRIRFFFSTLFTHWYHHSFIVQTYNGSKSILPPILLSSSHPFRVLHSSFSNSLPAQSTTFSTSIHHSTAIKGFCTVSRNSFLSILLIL